MLGPGPRRTRPAPKCAFVEEKVIQKSIEEFMCEHMRRRCTANGQESRDAVPCGFGHSKAVRFDAFFFRSGSMRLCPLRCECSTDSVIYYTTFYSPYWSGLMHAKVRQYSVRLIVYEAFSRMRRMIFCSSGKIIQHWLLGNVRDDFFSPDKNQNIVSSRVVLTMPKVGQ